MSGNSNKPSAKDALVRVIIASAGHADMPQSEAAAAGFEHNGDTVSEKGADGKTQHRLVYC